MRLFDNPTYVTILHRYRVLLDVRDGGGLTPEQDAEFQAANEVLIGIEKKYCREHSLRGLTNDYDQLAVIGDLGGVEL